MACAYGALKLSDWFRQESIPRIATVQGDCQLHRARNHGTELSQEMTPEYIAEKKALIPMDRFCTLDEIAGMTAWVASPLCSFTTGQVFDVTGGRATF